jgi:membrane protein DedA with SNARE-associated domain
MDKIFTLIEHYGYLFVFFGVMLGCSGIPFPGATILLAAGILVQQGHLKLGEAIVFGLLGAIIGSQIGYWAGRRGGRSFVLKWGRYIKITPERLGRVERFFVRYGGMAVFASRFVSVFRVLGGPVAGISRMRRGTFFLYSALGGMVWTTAVVLLGYFFGQSWAEAQHWTGRAPSSCLLSYSLWRWASISPTGGCFSTEGRRLWASSAVPIRYPPSFS